MGCFELIYSKTQIRKAGEVLRIRDTMPQDEVEQANKVLSSWRTAHAFHLSKFNTFIRGKIKQGKYTGTIIGQRLKRAVSIIDKLERYQDMSLDRMQDIAGIRVVLKSVKEVYDFQKKVELSRGGRKYVKIDDYIKTPKKDGYRSLHTIFKCSSKSCPCLDGLRVELQIRTRLQHQWGTAVETLGALTKSSIKTGRGTKRQEEYFRIISALFSKEENMPVVGMYENLKKEELIEKLKQSEQEDGFTKILEAAANLHVNISSLGKAFYHVVELNTKKHTVSIIPFTELQVEQAEAFYAFMEERTRNDAETSIFLVSVGTVNELKKAYPNFFLDTKEFVKRVNGYLQQ